MCTVRDAKALNLVYISSSLLMCKFFANLIATCPEKFLCDAEELDRRLYADCCDVESGARRSGLRVSVP